MSSINETELNENDGLYTGILYDELEKSRTSPLYDVYCGSAKKPMRDNRDVRNICATLLNYLETKYSASDHTSDTYDVCKLLNYWVYKRLNMVLHYKGSRYINQVHAHILLEWNSFNQDKLEKLDKKICKPIDNIVAYDNWEKIKELYEYYVDYSTINQNIELYPQLCQKIYKYLKSKKPLYRYYKEHCTRKDTDMCLEFYHKYEQYDPEKALSHLQCNDEITHERAAALPRLPRIGSGHSVYESDSEDTDDRMKPDDAPKLSGKSQNVRMYGNVLLGVVATSMTSGALYRFTPLGGMIRNGLGWNNNNMSNINGGDFRLYDYASEPFNPYPGEEHYIGYHPA
ncbi:Plasmodium vivax Vir protein, putative [Plasmodium vivax]|uniref:Vir protein, putative n=1 Tax=Plasmodium vivax TaxID=5855 RepID=A0A1G4EEI7_PLAVI|nr:Plasmodium vivax Vir protein, putative [Plasmodium vivax]